MAATLQDLYEALQTGASRATLLRMIEELDRRKVTVPPSLRLEILEMTDVDDADDTLAE